MSGWLETNLRSVATLQRGFDLPTRLRRRGPVPIVSSSGVSGWHDRAMVKAPGVVTGRYGTIGEVFFEDVDFWPLNTTLWVSNFHGNDERFVYYLLQRVNFATHSGKSGVPGVNRNDLHQETVSLPDSVAEQRQVAAALQDADKMIGTLERVIAKKQAIKQGMIQQLLAGKIRLPGFTREWISVTLGEVANKRDRYSLVGGPFGSSLTSAEYTPTGVRILQLQNIGDGQFRNDYAIYTSEQKADSLRSCNIYPGDLLLAKMGDPVARACVVPAGRPRYVMASDGIRLSVDTNKFDPRLVMELINSEDFRNAAESVSTGSTRKRIALGALRRLRITVPKDLAEQRAVANGLNSVDRQIAVLRGRLAKARAVKQGMMQELLTGRTRLPVEVAS